MTELPRRALSVRQPWAWAIIHAGKTIENRSRGFFGMTKHSYFLGPVAIHAAKGMTQEEYRESAEFMASIGIGCPAPADLVRGGIIGHANCAAIVSKSHSPWFFGPFGLIMEQQTAVEPIPCSGALGYFNWTASGELEQPLRWMRQWGAQPAADPQGRLLDFEKVKI